MFYVVSTLYFDNQKEDSDNIRQKGYSKDEKAHKTQVVLGILVDKMRNPITYTKAILTKGNNKRCRRTIIKQKFIFKKNIKKTIKLYRSKLQRSLHYMHLVRKKSKET